MSAACGGSDLTVRVVTEGTEGNPQPVEGLPVTFLPYDRDSLFDALGEQAAEPEPPIPADLQEGFSLIQERQAAWQAAEAAWAARREELRELSERLQGMDPRSEGYLDLFQQFEELDAEVQQLDQRREQAFAAFDSLQQGFFAQRDSIQAVRAAWADVAFGDFFEIQDSLLVATGREIYEDTTNAEGFATPSELPGGTWYVFTRVPLALGELYWNEQVMTSETDTLVLSPENAERRLGL